MVAKVHPKNARMCAKPAGDATGGTVAAYFSPMHSGRARSGDPDACCYIQFLPCETIPAAGH